MSIGSGGIAGDVAALVGVGFFQVCLPPLDPTRIICHPCDLVLIIFCPYDPPPKVHGYVVTSDTRVLPHPNRTGPSMTVGSGIMPPTGVDDRSGCCGFCCIHILVDMTNRMGVRHQ